MRSTSLAQLSVRFAQRKGLIVGTGVALAAAVALLLGDSHSLGMTYN